MAHYILKKSGKKGTKTMDIDKIKQCATEIATELKKENPYTYVVIDENKVFVANKVHGDNLN